METYHSNDPHALIIEYENGDVDVQTVDGSKTRHFYEFESVDDEKTVSLKRRRYKTYRMDGQDNKNPQRVTRTVRKILESRGYTIED